MERSDFNEEVKSLIKKSQKKKLGVTADYSVYEERFKLLEEHLIGTGSFGRTFLGVDLKKQRKVAIKVVSKRNSYGLSR